MGYVSGVTVYGWLSGCFFGFCWNIPLFGTIDMQFSVYSIDCNCVPPQPTGWLITGLSGGVLAWPTGMSSMRAAAPWAIWDLLGHYGEIQLTAANPQGQLGHFNVPVWW